MSKLKLQSLNRNGCRDNLFLVFGVGSFLLVRLVGSILTLTGFFNRFF